MRSLLCCLLCIVVSAEGWWRPDRSRPWDIPSRLGLAPPFEPWWSMGVHPPSWALGPRSPWWVETPWDDSAHVGCTPAVVARLGCRHGTYVDKMNRCKCAVGLDEICLGTDLRPRTCAGSLECSSETGRCVAAESKPDEPKAVDEIRKDHVT